MTSPTDPQDPTSQSWDVDVMSPYVHWRRALGGAAKCGPVVDKPVRMAASVNTADDRRAADDARAAVHPLFGDGELVPLPEAVANPSSAPLQSLIPDDVAGLIPVAPPKDAVIVGIIDEAIALGHPRFRRGDGSTRFLASWQQGATFDAAQGGYLPFGNEIYQRDINALLRQHSDVGDPQSTLDETAFNRAALLSEPDKLYGVRALERRAGHGTAVLDLATGEDSWRQTPSDLDRRPILAASLPRRQTIGMAGTFLEYFAIYAMHRMVALADALWDAHYGGPGGFPLVLNVSYGQQAGAKDGRSLFEQAVERMVELRGDRAPLQVVMPAGNDNLMRCNAFRKVRRGGFVMEKWRVLPEDHSSNFVEVWTSRTTRRADKNPVEIRITTPHGETMKYWSGEHGQFCDIAGGARIYCQRVTYDNGRDAPEYRYRYVICTPPTAEAVREIGTIRVAPAGDWCIRAQNRGADTDIYLNVQVDQSAEPDGTNNQRSYFNSSKYRRYLDNGRERDTYASHVDPDDPDASDQEDSQIFGHVQRKGTINSLALSSAIVVVGSYRKTDGAPLGFSATAYPKSRGPKKDMVITACFPGDDGAANSGLLAAGTQGGSTLAPRGTSFSTARATRKIVEAMLDDTKGDGSVPWMQKLAKVEERKVADTFGHAHEMKRGHGRVRDRQTDRAVPRF